MKKVLEYLVSVINNEYNSSEERKAADIIYREIRVFNTKKKARYAFSFAIAIEDNLVLKKAMIRIASACNLI